MVEHSSSIGHSVRLQLQFLCVPLKSATEGIAKLEAEAKCWWEYFVEQSMNSSPPFLNVVVQVLKKLRILLGPSPSQHIVL